MEVDHAGLDHRTQIGDVDLEDASHARERHDDAALDGNGAARQAGPGAPRDDRHGVLMTEARERRDVLGAFR